MWADAELTQLDKRPARREYIGLSVLARVALATQFEADGHTEAGGG